eukprot:TRINITY_DN5826_c0_g1_i3.p1 TRINITY_DN5826_c0_g1~~TRINITY_DN5826_c0_g1_i3.p1  ORF type:complete len:382 (-),score=26.65 TRINITY_DN5826_c0_g1_i3:744-1889(-)
MEPEDVELLPESTEQVEDQEESPCWYARVVTKATKVLTPISEPVVQVPWGEKYLPPKLGRNRTHVIILYLGLLCVILSTLYYLSMFGANSNEGIPERVSCSQTFWDKNRAGFMGMNFKPFVSDWFPIRCDALCSHYDDILWNVVGDMHYRADSHICKAAIHSGVITDSGGCLLIRASGEQQFFNGTERNGVTTDSYPFWFPKSFEFAPCSSSSLCGNEMQWVIFALNVFGLMGLVFLRAPDWVLFTSMAWAGFWYVSLVAQREYYSDWFEDRFKNLLPYILTCYIMYLFAKKNMLPRKFVIERCLLYVLPIWIGIHLKYFTFVFPDFDLSGGSELNSRNPTYPLWAIILTLVALGIVALVLGIFQLRGYSSQVLHFCIPRL